jgi:hypothetical protein
MEQNFDVKSRKGRFRAALLTAIFVGLGGCNATDSLYPDSGDTPASGPEIVNVDEPSFSTSFAGGIPLGNFHQPTSLYGTVYNGAMRNIYPKYLRSELSAIRSRGGKVMLNLVGAEGNYKDRDGHFSFTKWKARMDRFKYVDFNTFINDGTIIGHFLIDEPNDASNWGGRPIPQSTLEAMAKYSKMRWPKMATIVRAETSYMVKYSGSYHYLDGAWAQYLYRRGNVYDYIRASVSQAQRKGLSLVVGLNVLRGGRPNGTKMSASEVKSWGAALLSSSYPCAFLSWKYNSTYFSTSGIRDAFRYLRNKAQSRSNRSCRS